MAIHDRWYKDERGPDGERTGKQARTAEYGCEKRWQVRWRDEQGRQRKTSFARKTDAERADTTIQAQLLNGTYVDPAAGEVTFRSYAETWRAARMHDPATTARIESMFRNHVYSAPATPGKTARSGPAIGDYPLRILAKRVTILQGWLKGLNLHPNTIRQLAGDVSQVFIAAVDDGLINRNPLASRSVQKPAAVKTKPVPWTADQVEAVAAALRPARYAALAYLGAAVGARQGELFAVELADIDWLRKTISIAVQVKRVGGVAYFGPLKNKKPRVIPIADQVVPILSEHVRLHPPVPVTLPWGKPAGQLMTRTLIFTTPSGGVLEKNGFNFLWRRAWREAGLPDSRARQNGCHVLRHTAASAWLSAGLNIAKVAAYLGDTAEVVWRTYAHFMPEDDGRARDAMNAFFAPKDEPSDGRQAAADGSEGGLKT